ncbi:MAG: hypothetical protein M3077_15210 [Candidatus Dormibacteraeota bacterium]|nr:hypothetical protein [Candidatus Dormibacteraeota bacterium]
MNLPARVFVIVLLPESGRDPDSVTLLHRTRAGGERLTPVFSSMLLATTFLDRAQALDQKIPLDYIFPASGDRFAEDLPDYVPVLDISPESFFQG